MMAVQAYVDKWIERLGKTKAGIYVDDCHSLLDLKIPSTVKCSYPTFAAFFKAHDSVFNVAGDKKGGLISLKNMSVGNTSLTDSFRATSAPSAPVAVPLEIGQIVFNPHAQIINALVTASAFKYYNNSINCHKALLLNKPNNPSHGFRFAALDLEWDLKGGKEISLLQVAYSPCQALITDSTKSANAIYCILQEICLNCDYILVHDFHADALAMKDSLIRIMQQFPDKFIDTQLVLESFTGNPFGGFNDYLKYMECSELHADKKVMHSKMNNNANFWSQRPMSEEKMVYAAKDVMLLQETIPMLQRKMTDGIFPSLVTRLAQATNVRALNSIKFNGKRLMSFNSDFRLCSAEASEWAIGHNPTNCLISTQMSMLCDLGSILELLPAEFKNEWYDSRDADNVTQNICDIIMDLGQRPYFRQKTCDKHFMVRSPSVLTTKEHLESVELRLCNGFGKDNRAGIDGHLHRISAIKNKNDMLIGVTMRVGRHFAGNTYIISDLLLHPDHRESSILVVGPPGSGKTTMIREIARILAERETVVVVDTSNEICGDGDTAHPCVGYARRMMVKSVANQHEVMIECVQNHTPTVMIIDEIGRAQEVAAARTCKQRGVRMIASAHGDFRGLMGNGELNGLIGGLQQVTLGDAAAKERGCEKLCTERTREPVFDIIIEVKKGKYDVFTVIRDVGKAVDSALTRKPIQAQMRTRSIASGTDASHAQQMTFEFINLS